MEFSYDCFVCSGAAILAQGAYPVQIEPAMFVVLCPKCLVTAAQEYVKAHHKKLQENKRAKPKK